MPYIRFSLMEPRTENREDLEKLHRELLESFKSMKGFLGGYLIAAKDESGRIGRLSIWESPEDADHASMNSHVMAIRSEMRGLGDLESDLSSVVEQGFDAREI